MERPGLDPAHGYREVTGPPGHALRRLRVGDRSSLEDALRDDDAWAYSCGLDGRVVALARIAAIVGVGPDVAAFQAACNDALAHGATRHEIVGVLVAVTRVAGTARIMAAAPELGLALGFDIEASLEAGDTD